ncbi:MAG: dephospho-CoA kinase [Microbacteriaceae bacterium]
MYLIGLTGGIASGKSTVAARFEEHGAVVVDADELAREAVAPGTPALAAIADAFGAQLLREDGSLDRGALGAIVFADAAKRARLNAIVHPAVRRLSEERIATAVCADPAAVVVYDVPLLVEAAVDHPFDLIVVVHADEQRRIDRLVTLRGLSVRDATLRIRSQADDAERLAVADVVIDANGSVSDTLAQADAVWDRVSGAA